MDLTLLSLLLATVVTLLHECMGYIQTTALRWSLLEEGRLDWNTNLGVLTRSRLSRADSRIANPFSYLCVLLVYSAASQLFEDSAVLIEFELNDPRAEGETPIRIFNGVAGMAMALGLAIQVFLSS